MPHIKYFQPLADLMRPYQDFFMYTYYMLEDYYLEEEDAFDSHRLSTYLDSKMPHYFRDEMRQKGERFDEQTLERIIKEMNILSYMLGVRFDRYALEPLDRPDPQEVRALLQRILDYYCDLYNQTPEQMYKHSNPVVKNMALCCKHYLFQYSLPGYVRRLPEQIYGGRKDCRVPRADLVRHFLRYNQN